MTLSSHYLINGESDNSLSPMDRGLAYGDGVFRTLRVRGQTPHAWTLHFQKLSEDCAALGIRCPDSNLFLDDIERLFTAEEEAVAKIIVTRGPGVRGYAIPTTAIPTRIVIREALPQYSASNLEGVKLHICSLRLSHQPRLAGVKHLNRLENVLARSEWSDIEIADGLLLDEAGWVIECTMSNIFARFGNQIVTPALDQCGVAGVTRQRILDNARDMGYNPEISRFSLNELLKAEEVIICNSLYGAWQVRQLHDREWPALDMASRMRTRLQE